MTRLYKRSLPNISQDPCKVYDLRQLDDFLRTSLAFLTAMAASQQSMVVQAMTGLRRIRDQVPDSSDSDSPISALTNRGNKLKRKALYINEERLDYTCGLRAYKRQINHAGFLRNIIYQPRNREGDEQDGHDMDSDETGSDKSSHGPYDSIKLEDLLAPLDKVHDLHRHPGMRRPYYDQKLEHLTSEAARLMNKEKEIQASVNIIFSNLIRDQSWAPCAIMDEPIDLMAEQWFPRDLPELDQDQGSLRSTSSNGSLDSNNSSTSFNQRPPPLESERLETPPSVEEGPLTRTDSRALSEEPELRGRSRVRHGERIQHHGSSSLLKTDEPPQGPTQASDDLTPCLTHQTTNSDVNGGPPSTSTAEVNAKRHGSQISIPFNAIASPVITSHLGRILPPSTEKEPDTGASNPIGDNPSGSDPSLLSTIGKERGSHVGTNGSHHPGSSVSPLPVRRMTTRAQAAATNSSSSDKTRSGRSQSSTNSEASPGSYRSSSVSPYFLLPDDLFRREPLVLCSRQDMTVAASIRQVNGTITHESGLRSRRGLQTGAAPWLADARPELVRLMRLYSQKQNSIINLTSDLHDSLIRATDMRDKVLRWTKAEGHGEDMSDGEDWIDYEDLGIRPPNILDGNAGPPVAGFTIATIGKTRRWAKDDYALFKGMEDEDDTERVEVEKDRGRRAPGRGDGERDKEKDVKGDREEGPDREEFAMGGRRRRRRHHQ